MIDMKRFKTFISIDDTDEIGYHLSTGAICENIREHIVHNYDAVTKPITRHQLFLHEAIPYTSHNSSMCFAAFLSKKERKNVTQFILDYVEKFSAPSSNPGVCIGTENEINDLNSLIQYGFDAKRKVLTKDDAYNIAKEQNLFLAGIKNTEEGIIGAAAGVALRAYGSDGRIKGKIYINQELISANQLIKNEPVESIRLENGQSIEDNAMIIGKREIKMVYINHKSVLLVEKVEDNLYRPLSVERLRLY